MEKGVSGPALIRHVSSTVAYLLRCSVNDSVCVERSEGDKEGRIFFCSTAADTSRVPPQLAGATRKRKQAFFSAWVLEPVVLRGDEGRCSTKLTSYAEEELAQYVPAFAQKWWASETTSWPLSQINRYIQHNGAPRMNGIPANETQSDRGGKANSLASLDLVLPDPPDRRLLQPTDVIVRDIGIELAEDEAALCCQADACMSKLRQLHGQTWTTRVASDSGCDVSFRCKSPRSQIRSCLSLGTADVLDGSRG